MPRRRASRVISSLSKPISGRSTGSAAAASITARFSTVCDATCPTDSPVTSACAPQTPASRSAIRIIIRR